jgi:isoleucyl-tRNA synthetase
MYNFKEIEEAAKKRISNEEISKTVSNDTKRKKLFSFLEGPPTANAPPALHHLEVRTYKDIINKFRYMQGFNVPRKAGWDCHGLPVEVQIEKKLKLNSKKEILTYGEAKFIQECRNSVFSYIESWNKSTERLGYWVDLENAYATLTNEYIESVWWSLKELYKKKILYEAHKVVPFCPRCETPLSSHEVAQGYKSIKEESVIVKFPLKKEKNHYLLVFTTTPWTLPSNVGIAVNPDIDYVYVKSGAETYIVAEKLASNCFENPTIVKTVKGKKLLGLEYTPLFPYFKDLKAFWIIESSSVTETEGTGLVHMAPAFGEEDYEACKKAGLPFIQPVDETGKFTNDVPDYAGRFIKSADKEIIKRLEEEETLFKKIAYEHDYPFCWRCDTPLMYYAIKSWFIRVTNYRDRLLALNDKINWTPKHIREGRFGEWLSNVKDWALSRKKFWGTPLPIWRCDCGHEEIIGSVKELKEKATKKFSEKEMDLHKPWIDNIVLTCTKCKEEMVRVPDVIDCWYDSGSASFAQLHYPFENKEAFEKRFPYDFITEAIDQTRGWFYTLHVLATILFDDVAYKNVICAGHIVDEKGEKMSKSKGNILDPDMVLNSVGVDATRLQFCTTDIGGFKKFGIEAVKKEIFFFLNVFWNTYQFYTQLDASEKAENNVEDKWIISKLHYTIKTVTENLENYQIEKALNPLMDFIVNDFSKTYIKMIRDREDAGAKKVVGEILEKTCQLLAPYAPNIGDVVFSAFSKKSVHLSDWPSYDKSKINTKLEDEFKIALEIIEKGLFERDKLKIGLRWPLASATYYVQSGLSKEVEEIVARQLNVKKMIKKIAKESNAIKVELDTKMTLELESEGFAREIMRKIQAERKKKGLVKKDRITLTIIVSEKLGALLKEHKKAIGEKTGASTIEIKTHGKAEEIFTIREESIGIIF